MREIDHAPAFHHEIDDDGRAAETGVRLRRGVGSGETPEPGNVRGKLQHTPVVDIVNHYECTTDPID